MRLGRNAFVVLVLASLFLPASASAKFSLAISDQNPAVFSQPLLQRLNLGAARLIVSWNAADQRRERAVISRWLRGAAADGMEPMIAFGRLGGPDRVPSVTAYTKAVVAFEKDFPSVTMFTAWNEANDGTQPTAHDPAQAARYYNALVANCPGCTVVAADVLDQPGMGTWIHTFRRFVRGNPQLWGLHNYEDVNHHHSSGTREFLRDVPGQVWLTETGGLVRFNELGYNPKRAAAATRYLFQLAAMSSRIKRVYLYNWFGTTTAHSRPCHSGERGCHAWDSGLVNTNGTPRPAYYVVAAENAKLHS